MIPHSSSLSLYRPANASPRLPLDGPVQGENLLHFGAAEEKARKKTRLTAEEQAARQVLESQAPLLRKALPVIFKLWSPLPENGREVVKYGHIDKFVKALQNTEWYQASPRLQSLVTDMMVTAQPNAIHQAEKAYFTELSELSNYMDSNQSYPFIKTLFRNLDNGALKDAVIARLLSSTNEYIRGLAAAEFSNLSNPAMRKSLAVMIQNLDDFASIRQSACPDESLDKAANLVSKQGLKGETPNLKSFESSYPSVIATEAPAESRPADFLPLGDFLKQGLQPYADCGFSMLGVKPLLNLLTGLGKDEGALIGEVIPAYRQFVEFAVKRADKFVKAGQPVPSEAVVRAMLTKDGINILKAIILLGNAPLQNALDMKRLPVLLTHVADITRRQSNMLASVSKLSGMMVDPADCLKLLEFVHSFENVDKGRQDVELALEEMVAAGKPDIKALGKLFLKKILADEVLENVEISDAQVDKWNLQYLSTLASALKHFNPETRKEMLDICKAALEGKFREFLHDPTNKVGRNNLRTKRAFNHAFSWQGLRLNYDQWLNYQGKVTFVRPGKNKQRKALNEDMSKLVTGFMARCPEQKARIDSELKDVGLAIEDGQLCNKWGSEITANQYSRIFYMSSRYAMDNTFLTEVKPLRQREESFRNLPDFDQPLKIELWEREPGHDLFLGNYTGACIALDNYGGGRSSMEANQNTFVQVAYVKNPETNKVVGKAMFYIAKNRTTGQPMMVLNTYEARGKDSEGNYEKCLTIRKHLVDFAKDYSRAVIGRAVPLYTGTYLNPIYLDDLPSTQLYMSIVGSALNNELYLDSLPNSRGPISGTHYNNLLKLLDEGDPLPARPQTMVGRLMMGMFGFVYAFFGGSNVPNAPVRRGDASR